MKKILFLIIFFIPMIVYAEDIEIKSVTVEDYYGNIEEIKEPSIDSNNVNLNLRMNVIDDSITYKVILKNTSSKEYTLANSSLDKDYVSYDVTYDNDSNVIKSGEEKTIFVNVNYVKKPTNLDNGTYKDDVVLKIDLETEDSVIEEIVNAITNPNTSDKVLIVLSILVVSLVVTFILLKKYKKVKNISMLIMVLLVTPLVVKAVSVYTININANIEIDVKDAMFLTGGEVNTKMKILSGDDTSLVDYPYNTINTSIVAIKYSETEPSAENKTDEHIVSTSDSPYPIYMWFDNGIIYWWSEDRTPSLNENASYMFTYLTGLTDMSGLETFDVSNAKELVCGFASYLTSSPMTYTSLESLANWNTSNLEDIDHIFEINRTITTLDGLEKWDVSKVKDMSFAFNYLEKVDNLDALSNWNTSSVENMQATFLYTFGLLNIDGLANWDTSKVTDMSRAFRKSKSLTNLDALAKWDTSSVTDMSNMFYGMESLVDVSVLKDWNTSSVINMSQIFRETIALAFVEDLNWNTANVTDFSGIFRGDSHLRKVDLSNFDMSNATSLGNFFYNCNILDSIKTPKAMPESGQITLSIVDFYDEDDNLYNKIDNSTHKQIWIRVKDL